MLYVFRGLAGVANGGITSLTMIVVSDTVPLKERGKYQGLLGSCIGAGNMAGPFIAAAFVQRSTWRGLFWLLSPLAALCAVLSFLVIPTPRNAPPIRLNAIAKQIDFLGILTGSAGIILLLVPISGAGTYFAWSSPMVVSMLVVGSCCVLAFLFVEYRVALLPMMPCEYDLIYIPLHILTRTVSLFKSAPVCVMLAQSFLFGIVYHSQLYYLPLFFQNARRFSPITSAILILPITFAQMVGSILAGQYISRRERYGEVLWSGFILWTLGAGLTCTFGLDTPIYGMVPILAVQGIGAGLVFQPMLVALQAHCDKSKRAVVISNRNFLRSLGGAVGLAISATVLQNTLKTAMPPKFASLALSAYSTPDLDVLGAPPTEIGKILEAYAQASRTVFIMHVPLMGLCLFGCLFIKDHGLEHPHEIQRSKEVVESCDVSLDFHAESGLRSSKDFRSPDRVSDWVVGTAKGEV